MAKKFLDVLGDAFEEDMLQDVIPDKQKKTPSSRRKKRFVESINENLPPEKKTSGKQSRRKSLLDTMEEALDNNVFDEVFPEARTFQKKRSVKQIPKDLESRFSTMITTDVLERARQIALAKGMRVKDVINFALQVYVEKEWPSISD